MKNIEIKISVCMCTYNGEKYIKSQLDSIIAQTKQPDEIVIIDDNSEDRTFEIVKSYAKRFNNIIWKIEKNIDNIGWKENFHNAINKASGDYIFLADQDDIWYINKIEDMSICLDHNENIEALTTNIVLLNQNTGKTKKIGFSNGKIKKIRKKSYLSFTARPGCSMAIRKTIIRDFNQIWNAELPHDSLLWKIAYLKGTLYKYNIYGVEWRRHNDAETINKVKKISKENIKERYKVILIYFKYLDSMQRLNNIKNDYYRSLYEYKKMLFLRKKMYEYPSFLIFLQLSKYHMYYASLKSYILDFLPLLFKE